MSNASVNCDKVLGMFYVAYCEHRCYFKASNEVSRQTGYSMAAINAIHKAANYYNPITMECEENFS